MRISVNYRALITIQAIWADVQNFPIAISARLFIAFYDVTKRLHAYKHIGHYLGRAKGSSGGVHAEYRDISRF